MQLVKTAIRSRWKAELSASLLLILCAEIFLRFSDVGLLKVVVLSLAAIVMAWLAWLPWKPLDVAAKIVALTLVSAYIASRATRFSGLLKEPYPLELVDIFKFSLKVFLLAVVAMVLLRSILYLGRLLVRR